MAVQSLLERLSLLSTLPRKPISLAWARGIFRRLNAQYEAVFDAAAPGAAAQNFRGHDHADEGGGPIVRSSQGTVDAGDTALLTHTFTSAAPARLYWDFGPKYVSPGVGSFDLTVRMDVAICIRTWGGDVDVWCGVGEDAKVKVPASGESAEPVWVQVSWPVTVNADYQRLSIWLQPSDFQGADVDVEIYAVDPAESVPITKRRIGWRNLLDDLGDVAISTAVRAYFGTDAKLDDKLLDDVSWMPLHAYFWKLAFWSANALYEGILNRASPGASSQEIKGHDHYASGYGGRAIGHGCIWSHHNVHGAYGWITATLGTVNQWEYADLSETYRRTNSTPNATTGANSTAPLIKAYVTTGFTSSGAPPSSTPYLGAWIYVSPTDSTTTVEARLYNQTTATRSPAVTVTNDAWTYIRFVPCSGGAWNDFDVQIRRTNTTTSNSVSVKGLIIVEEYKYAGNLGTYASSSGSTIGGVPTSGTIKEPIT